MIGAVIANTLAISLLLGFILVLERKIINLTREFEITQGHLIKVVDIVNELQADQIEEIRGGLEGYPNITPEQWDGIKCGKIKLPRIKKKE